MAHQAQREFCESVRQLFPAYFSNQKVLDVGSYDVTPAGGGGNNRYLFTGGTYLGCDIVKGLNVDHVGPAWTVPGQFSVVISTEMLEHDEHWMRSLIAMEERTAPGGLLIITCAGPGRGRHGFGPKREGWETMHYENRSPHSLLGTLRVESLWADYATRYNSVAKDTYFWGIKR